MSCNALRAELNRVDWVRGVKNRVNFLGVMEGFRICLPPLVPFDLGGERSTSREEGFISSLETLEDIMVNN